ncbi:hypothetical protein [Bacillus sp. G1(2015b)]|uniref:hypothetical protein n=1 Tax=Bacillus sp. G1(2015b) TaxID=1706732 RepID=UPI0007389BA2|nr:hypothetical protein [Bacillus sp. G1(2015b)]KUF22002.1 hypothetical protein AMR95_14800 [Bacillus sp. G1(2015b)]
MDSKFVVFNDFCDPFTLFYDDLSEAQEEFKRRTNDRRDNTVDIYLCCILESHQGRDEEDEE